MGNGIIVLLTKCTDEAVLDTSSALVAASKGNAVWVILYPMESDKNYKLFKDLASSTGGIVMTVREHNLDTDTTVRQELSQAFRQLLNLEPNNDLLQVRIVGSFSKRAQV